MALCGEGAVCIWNGVTPESEDDFYAWHNTEHMPERVGIPGFLRGRRYIAADPNTFPKFFTLYETITPEVTTGQDYLGRLNSPTPWTRRATKEFRDTFRALTRVRLSLGSGSGGAIATLRAVVPDQERAAFERKVADTVLPMMLRMPKITGAHLCVTDVLASAGRTAETRDRNDIMEPPNTSVLLEGCSIEALRDCVAAFNASTVAPADVMFVTGLYQLEYTRLKTAVSPG